MFNLEQSIADWRRQMIGGGIKTPVPMAELESHLREEIERQTGAGIVEDRAFNLAVERIGGTEKLQDEFRKIEDVARGRKRELLRRWSVLAGAAFVYCTLGTAWYLGSRSGTLEISRLEIALAAGAIVPMILFGWVGRSVAKFLPVIHEGWVVAISLGAMFVAAWLFRVFFPAISPVNMVHLQLVVLWLLSPGMGLANCVSAWAAKCEGIRKKSYRYV